MKKNNVLEQGKKVMELAWKLYKKIGVTAKNAFAYALKLAWQQIRTAEKVRVYLSVKKGQSYVALIQDVRRMFDRQFQQSAAEDQNQKHYRLDLAIGSVLELFEDGMKRYGIVKSDGALEYVKSKSDVIRVLCQS